MAFPRILIVGGGFSGVFAAKKLDSLFRKQAQVTLISNSAHFEYHAQLYKVLSDSSPLQACIPLNDIFANTLVKLVQDKIVTTDFKKNAVGGSEGATYHYDYLILSLGSENCYFNIPGLSKFTYSFRNINEALRLSRHLHELIQEQAQNPNPIKDSIELTIVGGGPSGVEISSELAEYTSLVALSHHLDPKIIHIKLVEAMPTILPMLSTDEINIIRQRLQKLGVKVIENSKIHESTPTGLVTENGIIKSSTVIWVAGTRGNSYYTQWGLTNEKNGKVKTNDYLQPVTGPLNIYVSGDAAAVPGSGQAWPAIVQGETAAINIYNTINNLPQIPYQQPQPMILMPVGTDWAFTKIKGRTYTGSVASLIRELHNFKFYFKLLPFEKAWDTIKSGGDICSTCRICEHHQSQTLN